MNFVGNLFFFPVVKEFENQLRTNKEITMSLVNYFIETL